MYPFEKEYHDKNKYDDRVKELIDACDKLKFAEEDDSCGAFHQEVGIEKAYMEVIRINDTIKDLKL